MTRFSSASLVRRARRTRSRFQDRPGHRQTIKKRGCMMQPRFLSRMVCYALLATQRGSQLALAILFDVDVLDPRVCVLLTANCRGAPPRTQFVQGPYSPSSNRQAPRIMLAWSSRLSSPFCIAVRAESTHSSYSRKILVGLREPQIDFAIVDQACCANHRRDRLLVLLSQLPGLRQGYASWSRSIRRHQNRDLPA